MLKTMPPFLRTQGKSLGLLAAMLLGVLLPQAHVLEFMVRYLLMVMLFLAFLDIELKTHRFHKSVLLVLLANIALGFIFYALLSPFGQVLAMSAFLTAIAPTAIAAPVITGFIGAEVEYVVTAVLLTNISSALVIPIALPFLLGAGVQVSVWDVLQPVLVVMFVPMLLAGLIRRLSPSLYAVVRKGRVLSFGIWLSILFIIIAKASDFLRGSDSNALSLLVLMALISLVICAADFGIGALLGGAHKWREASQSLGQKNLSFVIWIALTFINPLVAMGPTFYILYHHLYNSWSIYRFEKSRLASPLPDTSAQT